MTDVSVTNQIKTDDFKIVAETIVADLEKRRKNRSHLEKQWKEIDRQLRMEPELSHKQQANGQLDKNRAWMPEVELPLQAQTLEMLTSDNRRLKFPKNRDYFTARAALTEKYVKAYESAGNPIPGEKGDNKTILNQDNGDRLAQAVLSHFHSQYDFRSHVDQIDAQAYSYGFGVGRIKRVSMRILGHDARGKSGDFMIPVLIPRNAKNVYLDDSQHSIMHEGHVLGPNIIQVKTMKLADLQAAAKDDKTYIKAEINRLKADTDGNVELVELEGDMVIDKSSETVIERDVVVTVAIGNKNSAFVRFEKGEGFSTYLIHEYHLESPAFAYGTSPLIKGMPVAKAAAQAMNRVIESGLLKTSPPIGYSQDDTSFASTGGPIIEPYAQWQTIDDINVYDKVGGDPATMFAIFQGLIALYADVTGVNPPRLGAQTKSHTTAFAKDVEISQGSIRTVDYVNSSLEGPMTRFLELEYRMGIKDWKQQLVYVAPWNEFVELKKGHLPDTVKFIAIGAGAPAEDQARTRQKLEGAQTALQIDAIAVQLGKEPKLDHGELIKKVLQESGWSDVTEITVDEDQEAQTQANGQLPGILSQGGDFGPQ